MLNPQRYINFFESLNKQRRAAGAEPYKFEQVRYTRKHYDEYTTHAPGGDNLYEYFTGVEVSSWSLNIPEDCIISGTFNFKGVDNDK